MRYHAFFEDLAASNKPLRHVHFATLVSLASVSRLICLALLSLAVPLGYHLQNRSFSSF
jgi:hypothetical protein